MAELSFSVQCPMCGQEMIYDNASVMVVCVRCDFTWGVILEDHNTDHNLTCACGKKLVDNGGGMTDCQSGVWTCGECLKKRLAEIYKKDYAEKYRDDSDYTCTSSWISRK